jgi:hypothetical protein
MVDTNKLTKGGGAADRMTQDLLPSGHRAGAVALFATTALVLALAPANARITEIDVNTATSQASIYSGQTFGVVGAYRMINGTVKGEVDPHDPLNAVIVDIDLAPRNSRGMVEYSTDFQLLAPMDLSKGNHRIVYDVTNRGGANVLAILNDGGAQSTSTPGAPGNGFVFNQGYTVLATGWDITVAQGGSSFGVTVPVAKNRNGTSITGPALEEFDIDAGSMPSSESLTYAAASADKSKALLTVRANFGDTPIAMPSSSWDYADSTLTAIKLNGHNFGDPAFFGPSGLYEFSYTAKDPLVAALGLAALRDVAAFFRDAKADDKGHPNPIAGDVQKIYTFCSSQPCRTMHDFLLWGFNEVEHRHDNRGHDGHDNRGHGRDGDNDRDDHGKGHGGNEMAFDGVLNWKAGASGVYLNYRFAQPTRTHRQHIARWFPEYQFPFANQHLHDPVTGKSAGRLDACLDSDTCPKLLEANSANEYWAKAGSIVTTDIQGRDLNLSELSNVRYYLFSSVPHGAGSATSKGICAQLLNPLVGNPVLRALLVDLDAWVTNGVQPPKNNVPTRAAGTLVPRLPQAGEGFPTIPGVTYNGIAHTGDLWDFGRGFDDGIISIIPPISLGTPYPVFVPKTDSDGNDIAGIRTPDISVPIATYTGWALRATPAGETGGRVLVDGCDASGQRLPFAATLAARQASGDPRPSLAERYSSHADYVAKVTAAAQALQAQRLLVDIDVAKYISTANVAAVP